MKKHIFLLVPFFSFLLTACYTGPSRSELHFREVMYSWFDRTFADFSSAWGYSNSLTEAPNGNKVYVYQHSRQISVTDFDACRRDNSYIWIKGERVPVERRFCDERKLVPRDCTIHVEVNQKKIIQNISWNGNGCDSEVLPKRR